MKEGSASPSLLRRYWPAAAAALAALALIIFYMGFQHALLPGVRTVGTDEARTMMAQGALALDVRGSEAWTARHVKGRGTWVQPEEIGDGGMRLPAHLVAYHRNTPLILYGSRYSLTPGSAARILGERRFVNVVVLRGGVDAWQAAGLPVEGSGVRAE